MTVNFNPEQLKAINEYRKSNNAGYVISDEAVVQLMIKDGKLPAFQTKIIIQLSNCIMKTEQLLN